jgi:hypothetical protein
MSLWACKDAVMWNDVQVVRNIKYSIITVLSNFLIDFYLCFVNYLPLLAIKQNTTIKDLIF